MYNEQISDLLRPALAQPQTVQTSGRGLYEVAVSDVKQVRGSAVLSVGEVCKGVA